MTTWFLRIAAFIALVQGLGHTTAVMRWAPRRGIEEAAVIEAMRSHAFSFQGFTRTYWDFFYGYGLLTAFTCVIEALVFWQLAALSSTTSRARPIVVALLLANLGFAFLSWKYFFFTPLILDASIATCLCVALAAPWLSNHTPGSSSFDQLEKR